MKLFKISCLMLMVVAIATSCSSEKKTDNTGLAAVALLSTSSSPVNAYSTATGAKTANDAEIAKAQSGALADATTYTAADLKDLKLKAVISAVDMTTDAAGDVHPKVTFYVYTVDGSNVIQKKLKGYGWTTKTDGSYTLNTAATATAAITASTSSATVITNLTAVSNMQFAIAKLVSGGTSPDKWVDYIVNTVPVTEGKTADGLTSITRGSGLTWPSNDSNGTIKDNGDGSYTYTFLRAINKTKDYIGVEYLSSTVATYGTSSVTVTARQTAVGDLTYNPAIPHRVTVFVGSGSVRGTSTNNTDGTNKPMYTGTASTTTAAANGTVTAVAGINHSWRSAAVYDFIPSGTTGTIQANQRDIVRVDACNNCHLSATYATKAGISVHGTRNDVRYCVTCHTDQVKVGSATAYTEAISNKYLFPDNTANASGRTYLADGESTVDFPIMIHKLHMGSKLQKSGPGYNAHGFAFNNPSGSATAGTATTVGAFNAKDCSTCHTKNGSAVAEANWKTKPSRVACGSCHDQIAWTAKTNYTAGQNHVGGAQTTDAACATCHTAEKIATNHGQ